MLPAIQAKGRREALGGGGARSELRGRLKVPERFAAPVRQHEREEPMFDPVSLARARRKVVRGNPELRLIRPPLQFELPHAQAPAVAAARVRGDEDLGGVRIETGAISRGSTPRQRPVAWCVPKLMKPVLRPMSSIP